MASNRTTRVIAGRLLWTAAAVALLGAGGCSSAGKALGMSKITPDEFRVVTKAPLVVPPDYALRPPAPGEPRPQELQPESQARAALLGQNAAVSRSQGESLLAQKAGADRADPLIRYVVDDEFGDVAHKEKGFVDKLLSFGGGDAQPAAPAGGGTTAEAAGAKDPAPLDPATAEANAAKLTGNKTIVISRKRSGGVKLPGL
jgi:hypothetical protein